jgi:serine/threonine protein kinase
MLTSVSAGTPLIDRWLGRRVGEKFVLERLLGRGGMGAVYEAVDETIDRRVAIKLLEPMARLSKENVRRFVREARAAASIRHPHVVSIFDVGEDRYTSALFIVQELLRGSDLRTLLSDQPQRRLPVGDAIELLLPIADALQAAHAHGVVHGDVTPANVFVVDPHAARVPKLIDFGLSRRLDRPLRRPIPMGTRHYCAPEQARGEAFDERADFFSFGALLYRCLAGVPSELASLVHRALDPQPQRRFRSMSEIVRVLARDSRRASS